MVELTTCKETFVKLSHLRVAGRRGRDIWERNGWWQGPVCSSQYYSVKLATLIFYFPSVDYESRSEASVHDEFVSTSALKIA